MLKDGFQTFKIVKISQDTPKDCLTFKQSDEFDNSYRRFFYDVDTSNNYRKTVIYPKMKLINTTSVIVGYYNKTNSSEFTDMGIFLAINSDDRTRYLCLSEVNISDLEWYSWKVTESRIINLYI